MKRGSVVKGWQSLGPKGIGRQLAPVDLILKFDRKCSSPSVQVHSSIVLSLYIVIFMCVSYLNIAPVPERLFEFPPSYPI